MKYKITDLMDLYEDKNCPLTPLDRKMQIIKDEKEIIKVKASKHAFDWKQGLALAASVALIVAGGIGVKALLNHTQHGNPGTSIKNTTSLSTTEVVGSFAESGTTAAVDSFAEVVESTTPMQTLPEWSSFSLSMPYHTTKDFRSFLPTRMVPAPVSLEIPSDWTEDSGIFYRVQDGRPMKILEPILMLRAVDEDLWETLQTFDLTQPNGEQEFISLSEGKDVQGRDFILLQSKCRAADHYGDILWYPCSVFLRDPSGDTAFMTYYFLNPEDTAARAELLAVIDSFRFDGSSNIDHTPDPSSELSPHSSEAPTENPQPTSAPDPKETESSASEPENDENYDWLWLVEIKDDFTSYGSGAGSDDSPRRMYYSIGKLDLDTPGARAINAAIEKDWITPIRQLIEAERDDEIGSPQVLQIIHVYQDMLFVTINTDSPQKFGLRSYCYDASTGRWLNDTELLNKVGISEAAFCSALREKYKHRSGMTGSVDIQKQNGYFYINQNVVNIYCDSSGMLWGVASADSGKYCEMELDLQANK